MKTLCLATTSLCLFAGLAAAQIPLPDFSSTYPGNTRGYYFQAPADLIVTHVQVPDETNVGKMLFGLYDLAAAPPAYSSTVDVNPVVFKMGKPSNVPYALVPPVTIKKGRWLAVLGACGLKTGSLKNSYGAAAYASSVLGNPVTLTRCGSQCNIATVKGVLSASTASGLWSEAAGSIARVRLFIVGQGQAMTYDKTTSASPASLLPSDPFPPMIGKTAKMKIKSAAANSGSLLAIGILRSNVSVPGLGTLLGFVR